MRRTIPSKQRMTSAERKELQKVLNGRRRLVQRVIEQRSAQLLADVESQLAKRYDYGADAWSDLTTTAMAAVEQADQELARRCEALGIRKEFRPSIECSWHSRGENAVAARRAELRRVAKAEIDVMAASARVDMETKLLDGLEMLARDALETETARQFLASLPTAEALMPTFNDDQIQCIEEEADRSPSRYRWLTAS
jgi:hypothetical protein